jgi:Flp pilus assembly protein TadG
MQTGMRKTTKEENGQTMVEFALVLPILLALVFGIVQFAIAFNNYLTLTDAVRAGSREGAVSRALPNPTQVAIDRVRSAASTSLDASVGGPLNVTVTFTKVGGGTGIEQGGDVTVRATYPYDIDIFGIPVHHGTLTSETTERVE